MVLPQAGARLELTGNDPLGQSAADPNRERL
jgi:hypothetical protein